MIVSIPIFAAKRGTTEVMSEDMSLKPGAGPTIPCDITKLSAMVTGDRTIAAMRKVICRCEDV
jgi:hypothetical protein